MENEKGEPGLLQEALTRRELNILAHVASGKSSKEIAALETLSYGSVKWYIHQVYDKLGVGNRKEAITRARALGLLKMTTPLPEVNPAQTPPPRTKNNLPHQLTSFIGRKKEINKLHGLLAGETARQVTLTGPGGTGKTRLALKAAEGLLEDFLDGIYLVELAPLSDPQLVLGAIAATLGLRESPDMSIQEAVAGYLENKHLLLILDNCEHLVAECARLAEWLLRGSSWLKLLVTSREILGISGEISLRVPPLELPDPECLSGIEELGQVEAVWLFVERAQQVAPEFILDEGNAAAVAQVCQRLDGIPLALELAAARLRMMTVQQVATRLDNVFRLLTGGSRSVLPRQQTLKATMDWSYSLLSTQEKLALQRLSVFSGSWTLEGAEAVCAGDGVEADEVLDLLGGLVDKSMVLLTSSRAGEGRYRMLEIVRQYAHDRLLESGEGEAARDRHLDYFLQFAKKVEPNLRGTDEIIWLDRVEQELPNLRLAMEWSLAGRVLDGMELAAALFWFWHVRDYSMEAIDWHTKLLVSEDSLPTSMETQADRDAFAARRLARARMLRIAFTWLVHGHESASGQIGAWLKESVAICRELGPSVKRDLAISLRLLGNTDFDDQSLDTLQEGLALAREVGDPFTIADCLWAIGNFFVLSTDSESSLGLTNLNPMELLQESLDLSRQVGYTFRAGDCLQTIAFFYADRGDLEAAKAYLEESLLMRRKLNDVIGIWVGLRNLGYFTYLQGDYLKAESLFTEILTTARSANDLSEEVIVTYLLSNLARSSGDYKRAAELGSKALDLTIDLDNKPDDLKQYIITGICSLGLIAWADGDYDSAVKRGSESLALAQSLGLSLGPIHYLLGKVALSKGDIVQAEFHLMPLTIENIFYIETRKLFNLLISPLEKVLRLRLIAFLANAKGQVERAVTIFSAIHDWEARIPGYYCPKERAENETALDRARAALGESAFAAAWQAGRALTLEQAMEATR